MTDGSRLTFDEKREWLIQTLQSKGVERANIDLLIELDVLEDRREKIDRDGDEYEMVFQILAERSYVEFFHLKQHELSIGEPWIRTKRPDFILLKAPDEIAAVDIFAFVEPADLMADDTVFKIDFGEIVMLQGFSWHLKTDVNLSVFHPLDAQWDEMNMKGWYNFEIDGLNLDNYRDVESNKGSPRYLQEVMAIHKAACGRLENLLQRFSG